MQDQAAFGSRVLRVQFVRRLQTVDPLLGGIHRGAHPYPVGCIALIGLKQLREQFTRTALIPRTKGFYCFLENFVVVSHSLILPYS